MWDPFCTVLCWTIHCTSRNSPHFMQSHSPYLVCPKPHTHPGQNTSAKPVYLCCPTFLSDLHPWFTPPYKSQSTFSGSLVDNIRSFFIQLLSIFLSLLASHLNFPCFLFTVSPLIHYPPSSLMQSMIFSFSVFH